MSYEERLKIFSKEVLTIDDISKLFVVGKSTAGMIFRRIKEKSDRLGIDKIIHLQDYLDAFNLPPDRYILDYNDFKTYIAK